MGIVDKSEFPLHFRNMFPSEFDKRLIVAIDLNNASIIIWQKSSNLLEFNWAEVSVKWQLDHFLFVLTFTVLFITSFQCVPNIRIGILISSKFRKLLF